MNAERTRLSSIPTYQVRRITNAIDWREQTTLWQALLKPPTDLQPALAA